MSEFDGFDLDLEAARAWSRFQSRLGEHLGLLGPEGVLVLEVDSGLEDEEGSAPYVHFARLGATVRAEISSNEHLSADRRLDSAAEEYLVTLGFTRPGESEPLADGTRSVNWVLDSQREDGVRLAVVTVSALRRVFGVLHPVFLSASTLGDDDIEPDLGIPVPMREDAPLVEMPHSVVPASSDHLRDLVDQALVPVLGRSPSKDGDGDIPVPHGSALVFVRVLDDQPVIEIFGFVVHGIADRSAAEVEAAILNRDHRFIKFVVADDAVVAVVQLPAHPFVGAHLRALLPLVARTLDNVDDDLARRTGGHRSREPGEWGSDPLKRPPSALGGNQLGDGAEGADLDAELPLSDAAVERLLDHLTREDPDPGPVPDGAAVPAQPGERDVPPSAGPSVPGASPPGDDEAAQVYSERVVGGLHPILQRLVGVSEEELTTDEVADLCGRDTQMLVRFLRTASTQELDWRRFRDQAMLLGDSDEADTCDEEMAVWEHTTRRLRAALRLVERSREGGVRFDPTEPPRRRLRRWRPPGHGPDER